MGKPHRYVIDLMHGAARTGQVNLVIRRRVQAAGEERAKSSIWDSFFIDFLIHCLTQHKCTALDYKSVQRASPLSVLVLLYYLSWSHSCPVMIQV